MGLKKYSPENVAVALDLLYILAAEPVFLEATLLFHPSIAPNILLASLFLSLSKETCIFKEL